MDKSEVGAGRTSQHSGECGESQERAACLGGLVVGAPSVSAGFIATGRSALHQDAPDTAAATQVETRRFSELPSQNLSAAFLPEQQRLLATARGHATID
jgi:hypothetical protein